MYVTYADLIHIGILIIALANLRPSIVFTTYNSFEVFTLTSTVTYRLHQHGKKGHERQNTAIHHGTRQQLRYDGRLQPYIGHVRRKGGNRAV